MLGDLHFLYLLHFHAELH
uniref:Uncharacterized protein n=1 Tax=Arundo donax TaxID=35708 RepID=A0A0A8ZES5_ARUDO